MAAKLTDDILKWTLDIDGQPAMKALNDWEQKTRSVEKANKALDLEMAKLKARGQENTEAFKQLEAQYKTNNATIKQAQQRMAELRGEVGVTGMTMVQLRQRSKELKAQLDRTVPDSTEWKKLSGELTSVSKRMDQVSVSSKKTGGGLSGLGNSMRVLPGAAGKAAGGVMGLVKAMWAMVANPIGAIIAAIVLGLMLLWKAFKSTDSGATALAGVMKALGNVLKVLLDRVNSALGALKALVTLDFKTFKEKGKDAFSGVGKAIKEAAEAGWEYEQTMDRIKDREAAAQSRMAKLQIDIEELNNLSKDQTKTNAERMEAAQLAIDKEVELAGIQKMFLQEKNSAETKNLANFIQNSKMTIEQKEAQLLQWLAIDDLELESMLKKDKAFADFYNKNEDAFQNMQKMKAEELSMDAQLSQRTRRLQSSLSGFKKQIADEESKAKDERQKKEEEALKEANKKELFELRKQMFEKGATKEETDAIVEAKELEHLSRRLALYKKWGKDTIDVEAEILGKQIKMRDDYEKQRLAIEKAIADAEADVRKEMELFEAEELKEMQAQAKAEADEAQKKFDRYEELRKKYQSQEKTDAENLNAELAELNEAFQSGGILSHEEFERKKAEITAKYAGERLKKEQEYLKVISDVANGLSDLFSAQKDAELAKAGDNAKEKERIEKKYAKKQQGIAKIQAGISAAQAIVQLWAQPSVIPEPANSIYKGVMTAIIGGTTLAQIRKINAAQFKTGGFTSPASSDSKPAGTVHANEWVASAPLLRNPETRRHIDYLENVQRGIYPRFNTASISAATRGFQVGGHTSAPPSTRTDAMPGVSVVQEQNTAMMGAMIGLLNDLKQNGVRSQINTQEVFSKQQQYEANIRASEL